MSIFRMPKPVKVTGLSSSVTKSFVNGIIPCINPTEEEVLDALDTLGMASDDVRCAYCGDACTEWDHLNPLIYKKTPTGYISEIHNLVPSCSKCNQSKGNREWREWIVSNANLSPKTRGIPDLEERIERLERYEETFEPVRIDFKEIVGDELWDEHWRNYEAVITAMEEARETSDIVKKLIAQAVMAETKRQRAQREQIPEKSLKSRIATSGSPWDVESSLRSIGKWFFLQNFDSIYEWRGDKKELVDMLLEKPNGKGRNGTNTSVNEALRLRDMGASGEALGILLKSDRFLHDHPEATQMIYAIRARHPELEDHDG